jgi:hypothetical protein
MLAKSVAAKGKIVALFRRNVNRQYHSSITRRERMTISATRFDFLAALRLGFLSPYTH